MNRRTESLAREGPVETSRGPAPSDRSSHPIDRTLLHVPFEWRGERLTAYLPEGHHRYPETWCEALDHAVEGRASFGIGGATVEMYDAANLIAVNVRKYWEGTPWGR